MKALLQYGVTVAFFALIFGLGIADIIKPDRDFSPMENRVLEQNPKFTVEKFFSNEYTSKYETYINDQFLFRDSWISLKSGSEYVLGKQENNGVVYGKEGYLFEKLESVDRQRVEDNLSFVRAFLQQTTAETTFVLIPNAYEVLEDSVPKGAPLVSQRDIIHSLYTQIMDIRPVNTIDLYAPFLQADQDQLFYRTDHHWTSYGAYVGYRAFCQARGLKPVELSELQGHEVTDFYGTLYAKCKRFGTRPETITYYETPSLTMQIRTLDGAVTHDSLYDHTKWGEHDKYAAFLFGNNDLTTITRRQPDAERDRLLVIKDSYANSMIPFLAFHYNEIDVVDLRSMTTSVQELANGGDYDDILIQYNFKNFITDTNLYRLAD